MCIIIAKDKNMRLPKDSELEEAFKNNSDGAGFMYTDKGKVIIDKGYMGMAKFMARYHYLCRKFDNFNDKCLVIHCRIGTDGSNTAKNTHPYALTNSIHKLHKEHTSAEVGIAHNGIIYDYKPTAEERHHDINDTQNFIRLYMYNRYKFDKAFYTRKFEREAINDLSWSKFAILDKNDNLYTIGTFQKDDNLEFSNDSYKPYSERMKKYSYNEDNFGYGYKYKSYSQYSGYDLF